MGVADTGSRPHGRAAPPRPAGLVAAPRHFRHLLAGTSARIRVEGSRIPPPSPLARRKAMGSRRCYSCLEAVFRKARSELPERPPDDPSWNVRNMRTIAIGWALRVRSSGWGQHFEFLEHTVKEFFLPLNRFFFSKKNRKRHCGAPFYNKPLKGFMPPSSCL